jgi:hypothetical protein
MTVTVCTFAFSDSERALLVFFQGRGKQDINGARSVTAYLHHFNLKISNGAASGFRSVEAR